jgi:hypothetical protein
MHMAKVPAKTATAHPIWFRVRLTVAFVALAAGGLAVLVPGANEPPITIGPGAPALWLLLVPVILIVPGLALRRPGGRWLGLAVAVAALPWAAVFALSAGPGVPVVRGAIALSASLVLIWALTGRTMFEAFEGHTKLDWRGRRMGLIRWTIICNLAAALTLYLFVIAYRFTFAWHLAVFGGLLLGMLGGVLLLARQMTVGLLLVWFCSIALVPAGAWFVAVEADSAAEGALLAVTLLPGLVTGWTTMFVFGKPIWRFLRSA